MSFLKELVEVGKEMGLEGKGLRAFVEERKRGKLRRKSGRKEGKSGREKRKRKRQRGKQRKKRKS